MDSSRQVVGLLLTMALVAVACRSEAAIDLAESDRPSLSIDGGEIAAPDSDATAVDTPPESSAETSAEGTGGARSEPERPGPAQFAGAPPPAFVVPDGWDQPFELDQGRC